jgi:lactate racemase
VGDDRYYDYVKQFKTVDAALDHFKGQPFRMGAHKSLLFGRTLTRFDVVVGSELEAETLNTCHLAKGEPQATIDRWIDGFPGRPRVAVVPNANTTYFYRR